MLKSIVRTCISAFRPAAPDAQAAPQIGADDYRRAEAMLMSRIAPKLLNGNPLPIWLPDGDRFWYKHESAAGWTYLAVDPVRATKIEAFDHTRLARAISIATTEPVDPKHLTLSDLAFTKPDGSHISFTSSGYLVHCDLTNYACTATTAAPDDPYSATSPDGKCRVFAREDNLWLKEIATGAERPLTVDGEPHFSYGKLPDYLLMRVMSQTKSIGLALYGVEWSPDSNHLVVQRVDERRLPDYCFLQMLPYDGSRRPKLATVRSPLCGEGDLISSDASLIDIKTGAMRRLSVGSRGLSTIHYWDPSGARFLALQGGDYSRQNTLIEVTIASGAVRSVMSEDSKTFLQTRPLVYDEPAMRFLPATNEMIWFSQRDGWNHLYLVDVATGAFKAKITDGPWNIQNILRVDEDARRIYFTAVGREAGEDPYWRHLYSANLDGSDLTLLTPEPADHVFPGGFDPEFAKALRALVSIPKYENISPSGRYMIDVRSTPQTPPVTALKRIDGGTVMPLETADASAAYAAGWIAPKSFQAKAADGITDLYGLLYEPHAFDPSRRYPVIDAIYNGPQVVTTAHNFTGAMSGLLMDQAQAFAQLGFVVVILDGRGTPMRSKQFQDYIYNNMQEFGVEDHVAAIKELAKSRPYMDLDRVGLFGHSFGGYTALKGILGYADFFKVAAASAGPYDLFGMFSLDAFFSPARFQGDAETPTNPADRPTNWGAIDLTQQASQLKGKLLLAYGDLDENAYPAVTVRMINALIAANKSFDLIYLPNRSHGFLAEPYFVRRRWDFFIRNLAGQEPPADFDMSSA